MNSICRRLGGLAIALLMIPVFIGLLACLPVPIGDPERSRIDPGFSGHWIMAYDDEIFLVAFEPYDKRTWLLEHFELSGDIEIEWPDEGRPAYESVIASIADQQESNGTELYKAWRVKLGKYWYMTWEPKGLEDFEPAEWLAFRINKVNKDVFELTMVVESDELFEDVAETRLAYERVIRKNQDNPQLFNLDFERNDDEDDEIETATYVMYRVAESDWGKFSDLY